MRKVKEFIVEKLILICGLACIFFVVLIFLFLLKEGLAVFKIVSPLQFLSGKSWYPISEPPQLGILPLILGSLFVTVGAAIISIPIGVACAIYIAEVAPKKIKEILKAGIELLAAIPSVVLGFIGMVTLVPWVKSIFHLPTGLTALSGSIMLAFMAMPTIVSIAEDALYSVPKNYKEGALALGATEWQTIWRVLLPAASSGILAAVMLGIGRVIGETMAVMMITGNAAVIPSSILQPVRTLTATIAAEMGEAVVGGEHYFALFAIGIVLFVISFAINVSADLFLHRSK
ncbi:MAG: phosphate ABC transporter permease subunit PstC [Candidatus Omnitrophica bacterium]|nr:phosphate ABC transporter permease subunit PstC [Candidatus Omnitrophota bacterium]MBU1869792.1 phosphate ABC transporter permease subunit PstC [Candidatus Omnitrophota bacterium]